MAQWNKCLEVSPEDSNRRPMECATDSRALCHTRTSGTFKGVQAMEFDGALQRATRSSHCPACASGH